MFDLETPLLHIGSLRLNAVNALEGRDLQAVQNALDEIQNICNKTLTDLNRLALIAGTRKEAKT